MIDSKDEYKSWLLSEGHVLHGLNDLVHRLSDLGWSLIPSGPLFNAC